MNTCQRDIHDVLPYYCRRSHVYPDDKKYTCHTESRRSITRGMINGTVVGRVGHTSVELYVETQQSRSKVDKPLTNVTKKQRDLLPSTGSSLTMFLHTVLDFHDTVRSSLFYTIPSIFHSRKPTNGVLLRR